jgi:hypothetical protein
MQRARIPVLALVASALCAAGGCYYRVENYGYSREIGIGRVGCQVANPHLPAPSTPAPPQGERVISITPSPAQPGMMSVVPQGKSTGAVAAPVPAAATDVNEPGGAAAVSWSPSLPKLAVPKLSAPKLSVPKLSAPKLPALDLPALTLPSVTLPSVKLPAVSFPAVSLPSLSPAAPKLEAPPAPPSPQNLPPPPDKGWVGLPAF